LVDFGQRRSNGNLGFQFNTTDFPYYWDSLLTKSLKKKPFSKRNPPNLIEFGSFKPKDKEVSRDLNKWTNIGYHRV